jgi:hypothetical protein
MTLTVGSGVSIADTSSQTYMITGTNTTTNTTTSTTTSTTTTYTTSTETSMADSSAPATLAQVCGMDNSQDANDGPCPKEFPFFTKKQSCVDACKQAKEVAFFTLLQCQQAASRDASLYSQSQQASAQAAANTQQSQQSNQTSAATNMSTAQDYQNQRIANAQGMVASFEMCILVGNKCDNEGGDAHPMQFACMAALQGLQQEIAALQHSSNQMVVKANVSTSNAQLLSDQLNSAAAGANVNIGSTDTAAQATSQITLPSANGATTDMAGAAGSGAAGGSGSSSSPYGAGGYGMNGSGGSGSGSGAGGGKLGNGGSGSGSGMLNGALAGLTPDGSGDGTGASSSADYSMNLGGGVKNGAGGGSGDGNSIFGAPKDGGGGAGTLTLGKKGDGKDPNANAKRGLAGIDGSGAINNSGMTIFQIVRKKYGRLHSDGQI